MASDGKGTRIVYSGTNPTTYEAEGRCWRCGGKDEREKLPGKRCRRPVCSLCAWTLIKTALEEPVHVHRFAHINAPCDICGQTASELWGFR